MIVDGSEIFCRMQVNIKIPEVDSKVDEESDTVKTTFSRCQMEGSVAIVVTFLKISPGIGTVFMGDSTSAIYKTRTYTIRIPTSHVVIIMSSYPT